jgi:hypothetical protein
MDMDHRLISRTPVRQCALARPSTNVIRLTVVALFLSLGTTALAAPVDGTAVVGQMRAALEPERSAVRQITFKVSGPDGTVTPVTVGEARGRVGDTRRILAVVLAPASLRGMSYLLQQGSGDVNVQWVFLPAVGRVRKMTSPEAHTAFLNSDFTYADLGFIGTGSKFTLIGDAELDGVKCQLVQAVPKETWAYSRTVTCIAHDGHLPVDRQIYDASNTLWKVQKWSRPEAIDSVPTILSTTMEDVQAKSRTDLEVGAVRYGIPLPESLFDPAQLGKAAEATIWAAPGSGSAPN